MSRPTAQRTFRKMSLDFVTKRWPGQRSPNRLPRKKALLIGINYNESLKGPQANVKDMKALLMSTYMYSEENIVLLSDAPGTHEDMEPTYNNIMRELILFTKDNEPGDQYFFLYAGHSDQQWESSDKSVSDEEDNKDEYIIPVDAYEPEDQDKYILDNTLRELMVNPLKPGNQLVAIFDTCHSGTLLDLEHFRCNTLHPTRKFIRRIRRQLTPSCISASMKELMDSNEGEHALQNEQPSQGQGDEGQSGCTTLAPMRRVCHGICPRMFARNTPHVLCISACKDQQLSYEQRSGDSMTTLIINYLMTNPQPRLKDLMLEANHRFRELTRELKEEYKKYEKQCELYEKKSGKKCQRFGEIKKQTPQLSSIVPLDMRSKINI